MARNRILQLWDAISVRRGSGFQAGPTARDSRSAVAAASRSHRQGVAAAALLSALFPLSNAQAGPKIESWQTSNGVKVLFVAAPELPILDIRAVFDAGSVYDGDLPGLSAITDGTLVDGAGPWNADQIADRLEAVGSELSHGSQRDMAWVGLRTLTEPKALETGLETLNTILADPTFSDADIERNRAVMITGLRQSEQNPGEVASKAFYSALYGTHPYGIDGDGTQESLPRITRDAILGHYKRYYVASHALVALVGAIDRPQAEAIAERLVKGLPAGEKAPALPPVQGLAEANGVHKPFPSTQSHILIGQPGIKRGDPDYFPLYLGNHILGGGGLVSILSDEVREKRGLSYSVSSYFVPLRDLGPFTLSAQTQNAKVEEALQVMRATLSDFIKNGPTEQQLKEAKQNLTGGFPLRIASNGKILEYLAVIGFYNLPLDYLDTFVGKIEAIGAEQIKEAFQRRVNPDRMVTLVVGKWNRDTAKQ